MDEIKKSDDSKFIDFIQDSIITSIDARKTIQREKTIQAGEKYIQEHKEKLEKVQNINAIILSNLRKADIYAVN